MLLRTAGRIGFGLARQSNPLMAVPLRFRHQFSTTTAVTEQVVTASMETFSQKIYRWLDVGGFLTRWYSRRAWILDQDPPQRANTMMVTEYERKLYLWLQWMNLLFFPISLWFWWGQFTHLASKPPAPLPPEYPYLNARKRDFGFFGGEWQICKECRFLEMECKKECWDKLREEGVNKWGLRRARTQTIGLH